MARGGGPLAGAEPNRSRVGATAGHDDCGQKAHTWPKAWVQVRSGGVSWAWRKGPLGVREGGLT